MFKIPFESQTRHNEIDVESGSIVLSKEDYLNLPVLSSEIFDAKTTYYRGDFFEQIRHPEKSYSAVFVKNPNWKLEPATPLSGGYMDDSIKWVFVCLDNNDDIWIAFTICDRATFEDAYGSTVRVSYPSHGDVYRLDAKCLAIAHRFYPKF